MKLEFSRPTFEKYSHIKFQENVTSGRRVFPWEQTYKQTRRSYQSSLFTQ